MAMAMVTVDLRRLLTSAGVDLESRPNTKDVYRYVIPYLSSRWREIGTFLDLSQPLLTVIDMDNRGMSRECLRSVIDKWLQRDVHATWRKLVVIIEQQNMRFFYCM